MNATVFGEVRKTLRGGWRLVYPAALLLSSSKTFVINLAVASVIKMLVDAIQTGNGDALLYGAGRFVVTILVLYIIFPLIDFVFSVAVLKMRRNLGLQFYSKIVRLCSDYIESTHSGDLMSRISNDLGVAHGAYSAQLRTLLSAVILGVGSLSTIFEWDYRLGLAVLGMFLFIFIMNFAFAKPLRRISRRIQEIRSSLTQLTSEICAGREVVRGFGLEGFVDRRIGATNLLLVATSMRQVALRIVLGFVESCVYIFSHLGVFIIGSVFIYRGTLSYGVLLSIIYLLGRSQSSIRKMGSFIAGLQVSLAGFDRILEIFNAPEEPTDRAISSRNEGAVSNGPADRNDGSCAAAVTFGHVKFGYPGRPLFSELSLAVPAGQRLSIVGGSGGGKSTLLKMIPLLYEPQSGDIEIFGRASTGMERSVLRNMIAYVSQDEYLLGGTIRDNIVLGCPDATDSDVQAAAEIAFAHEFIRRLPHGYDTPVDEDGLNISGGERQRIALARAVIRRPPILLLDEATASLDPAIEMKVRASLDSELAGTTIISVDHRLQNTRYVDRIIVIENGAIVEDGCFDELYALGGRFYTLFHRQQDG